MRDTEEEENSTLSDGEERDWKETSGSLPVSLKTAKHWTNGKPGEQKIRAAQRRTNDPDSR